MRINTSGWGMILMNKLFLMTVLGLVSMVAIPVVVSVYAHSDPDEIRVFGKNFCAGEESILGDRSYTDGHELSYDVSCPSSQIVVHNWDNISTAQQTVILTRMGVAGYSDITEQLLS